MTILIDGQTHWVILVDEYDWKSEWGDYKLKLTALPEDEELWLSVWDGAECLGGTESGLPFDAERHEVESFFEEAWKYWLKGLYQS